MRGLAHLGAAAVCAVGMAAAGCYGTTGDELVTFSAYARGAPDAAQPFVVGGFTIQLTAAKMYIGALYFDESQPSTSFDQPVCIATGVYAAQVPGPVEVDLLSSKPQEFSVYGNGSADLAVSWQIWLTNGDVNEANLGTHMVDLEGTATRGGQTASFGAIVTVNNNRLTPVTNPATPGENPICKERIIQLSPIGITFSNGGTLTVTIDPRGWFNEDIDFSSLPQVSDENCLTGDQLLPLDPSSYALAPETPSGHAGCGGSAQPCCTDDTGAPLATGACEGALTCNDSVCGPTYCIPNTNFAMGAGALAGQELFNGILTGGPSAYSVTYSQ
ncbi:MAG: hypothetical protein ACLP1X_01775 [Polyangiaceae bacterium]|jgi:hypothetical protein